MRKYVLPSVLLAVLGALIVSVLLHRSLPASPPDADRDIRKIRIANIGIYSNYNILADKLGFFRKHGLDAEVMEYDSGATTMDALLSGDADVAVAASFVGVRRIASDADVRILASLSSHDVFRILARRDRDISKPADIRGKRVGVTLKTAGEFYLGKFLTQAGLERADVEIVDLAASDILSGIQDGSIDAAVIFEPNAYFAEREMGGNAVMWSAQGNRRESATLYTTGSFAREHPETLERYLAALVEAERYQEAHGEEAKRILSEALGYDRNYADRIWKAFDFAVRLDQELLVTMEDQVRWNIASGAVEAAAVPDYLDYIFFSPLEKADPSAVTIIHR